MYYYHHQPANFRKKQRAFGNVGYLQKNNNNIYFGQNLLYKGYGTINVGDNIEVIRKEPHLSWTKLYKQQKDVKRKLRQH